MGTWKLWECLTPECLVALIQWQWQHYGLKLQLISDAYKELEPLEEIDRLMRQPPSHPVRVR